MIQRIQTVYLALAAILLVLCCIPTLASFEPSGMGLSTKMNVLFLMDNGNKIMSYIPAVIFVITVFAEIATAAAIMGYHNRRRQMRTCSIAMILELLWVIAFVVVTYLLKGDNTLHVCYGSYLPVVSLILTWLARKAIKKDDDLVRSADRIR